MNTPLADLPDYTALKKLAGSLWRQDNSYQGAAVMVGAGFSRCAARAGEVHRRLPLWNDLSAVLASELGGTGGGDPLRLAEEYTAYFGSEALRDLVHREINDLSWEPGELHRALLQLPWSDVLTTNWDTLLERTSVRIHQPVYSVVARQDSLSAARAPRIIKLHGTLGVTSDLVFTQEDYRRYPQRSAAFVNAARQVFIENELCLIGFSGDDPNFLQWAGWVRDNLATHARRIYLVGALGLTSSRRKYLESINVAPIDLRECVSTIEGADERHAAATALFLGELQSLKPRQASRWFPTSVSRSTVNAEEFDRTLRDASHGAARLKQQLQTLARDRAAYPGWLVCPSQQRWALQTQIRDPFPSANVLAALDADSRAQLLYEIAWRHALTYEAISSWMALQMLPIADPAQPCILTKVQQLEIALLLLKNTRWLDDQSSGDQARTLMTILAAGAEHWPDVRNEIALHNAIVARDRFDYPGLEAAQAQIMPTDSVWKLRKASLLAEIGNFSEGESLVADAYRELLGHYRNNRTSIYIVSRLAWASWLLRAIETIKTDKTVEELPLVFEELRCSPWDHIRQLDEKTAKDLEKQRTEEGVEAMFEPGQYRDHPKSVTYTSEVHPLLLLDGITGTAGVPLHWGHVDLLSGTASRLAQLDSISGAHRFALALRASSSDTSDALKRVFSRVEVACLPAAEAEYLLDRCAAAVQYWGARRSRSGDVGAGYALERMRVFIEVLARMSVRATPEKAKELFRMACSLGSNAALRHFWLSDCMASLLEYSLSAVPESEQGELLSDTLAFPLPQSDELRFPREWPNPIVHHPGARVPDALLDRRIAEVIEAVAPSSGRGELALLRLIPLARAGFLRREELVNISRKLWGASPDYGVVPSTGLAPSVLLDLAPEDAEQGRVAVRRFLFEVSDAELVEPLHLLGMLDASTAAIPKQLPTAVQAAGLFDRLVAWRPNPKTKDPFGFGGNDDQVASLIGEVLARSVVPAMSDVDRSLARFNMVVRFHAEAGTAAAMPSLPHFVSSHVQLTAGVEKIVREALLDSHANTVAHACYAVLQWRDLGSSPSTDRLVTVLVHRIGSLHTAGLPSLLAAARQLVTKCFLSEDHLDAIAQILPVVFDNADYASVSRSSTLSATISLVRAGCVRLARAILHIRPTNETELRRILSVAAGDPLPETRFAATTS